MPLTFDPSKPAGPPPRAKRRSVRVVLIAVSAVLALGVAAVVVAAVVLGGYVADAPDMPSREALWSIRRSPGMTFLDRNGHVIATRGAKYGQAVKLSQLPPYVPKAFLAAEDRRFYRHGPVDLQAIARAIAVDFKAKRSAEGASTLTQQLARTLFLKREQSLKRKVQEAYLAWELEQSLSKDEVLELYLNRTYFGDGAYGLDAAAQTYFGKPASQLTLTEAATLAGLPNAPTRLALTNDLTDAVARGRHVLGIMRTEDWISDGQYAVAMAATPSLAPPHAGEGDEGYVLDLAAVQAAQLTGGQTPDLVVRTTIDPALQSAGANILRDVVGKTGARRAVSQGAMVSLAPDGAILAMVGGLDHDKSSFNRVTQAHRQPGSSFKAFVYGAAVEHGATAQEVREDAPVSFGNWSPENYGHGYAGAVTLQQALARSLNTVSVRLTLELGPAVVADFARRLGLSDIPANPGPSIALGAYEVTPLELAAGYQVFQTGGGRTTPYLVSEIRSTRGDLVYAHQDSAPTPVLDPLYATRMVGMLKTVITAGTGTGANIGRPAAGKTGTSQDWRDAWFVGFTPDWICGVWVGNDDNAPMNKVTGGEIPAQMWRRMMIAAHDATPAHDFNLPPQAPAAGGEQVADAEGQPTDQTVDARSAFYGDLANDFDKAGGGQSPDQGPDGQPAPDSGDAPDARDRAGPRYRGPYEDEPGASAPDDRPPPQDDGQDGRA